MQPAMQALAAELRDRDPRALLPRQRECPPRGPKEQPARPAPWPTSRRRLMYLPARRTHPADIAGPVAAAAAAPSSASAAVPSRQRQHDVAPTDSEQPVNNVDAGEEEDLHELALKRRRASSAKLSDEAGTTAKAAPAAAAAAAVLIKSRSGRAVTLPKWMKGDGAFATGKVLNNVFHQQEAARAFDSDQAVDDVDSGEDVVHEPALKRRKTSSAKTSEYVGVGWDKTHRKWVAGITHNRKREHLGRFDDEREAGRAVDTAARRLRGEDAHGGRPANGGNVRRLNFPTEREMNRAQEKGMLLTEEGRTVAVRKKKVAAAAASQQQGPSEFVGVHWDKRNHRWRADIIHAAKTQYLGRFDDEQEAARAVDTAARRLRGADAHGRRSGRHWLRLSFPTEGEVKRAQEKGMLTEEGRTVAVRRKKVAAAAASQQQGPSEFVGVSWDKHGGSWRAQISTNGKRQYLDLFDDEEEAARAVDTAARRLRGDDAHGGRSGNNNWNRLNFPSMGEAWRAQQLGMPAARSSVSL